MTGTGCHRASRRSPLHDIGLGLGSVGASGNSPTTPAAAFILMLAVSLIARASSSLAAEPLHYDPAVVELSGTLAVEDHDASPNFGDPPDAPRPERIIFLQLDAPVDVVADPQGWANRDSFNSVRRVQLYDRGN